MHFMSLEEPGNSFRLESNGRIFLWFNVFPLNVRSLLDFLSILQAHHDEKENAVGDGEKQKRAIMSYHFHQKQYE